MSPGDFVMGDYVAGGICHRGLCRWGIMSRGIMSLVDFVMGDFVMGDFVMGDFDPLPSGSTPMNTIGVCSMRCPTQMIMNFVGFMIFVH